MELVHSLRAFLEAHVDLNATRLERVDDGIRIVTAFLKNDALFGPRVISVTPQGSIRQKTGIKPSQGSDFDVDLLVRLTSDETWEPRGYLEKLHAQFKKTVRYADIVDRRGKHRCVTLDYADDFHIDIVPSITRNGIDVIMNRQTNGYEPTDVDGYAQWFERQNALAGENRLVEVVKLAKHLRDRQCIPMKSVLLTTLLGSAVRYSDFSAYGSVGTALQVLIGRVDDFFRTCVAAPTIANPALPTETFGRHWDQDRFEGSRKKLHEIREQINAAIAATDIGSSVAAWQAVFGEAFSLVDDDDAENVLAAVIPPIGTTAHQQQVTAIPGCVGESLASRAYVRVAADLYSPNALTKFRGIQSGARMRSGLRIRYAATTNVRTPYDVYWQVVNTGAHALSSGGLRGTFFRGRSRDGSLSADPLLNWERSEYTGRHWIECFIIKDKQCIARSGPFIILVKNPIHP